MTRILEYKTATDFEKHILWQYNNAPAINSIMKSKQAWYDTNHNKFWNDYIKDVLNISSANDYGLSIWGSILQIPRTFLVNGVETTISKEQYRRLIQARMLLLRTRATLPEINQVLKFLFESYGNAYVVDNNDMTISYRFSFFLTDLQKTIMQTIPLLPKPAGVKANILVSNKVFGFGIVKIFAPTFGDLPTTGLTNGDIARVYQYSNPATDTATYYQWDANSSTWTLLNDYSGFFRPFNIAPFAAYLN